MNEELLDFIKKYIDSELDKKNEKDKKLNSNKKSNEQINYEKLVNLVNICMWEDILHSRVFSRHVTLSYNNYLTLCNYTLWELEKMEANK